MKHWFRRRELSSLLLCIWLVMACGSGATNVSAATNFIYVAIDGDDNTGTGSSTAPYLTVQKGLTLAVAGQTVYVKAGTYRQRLTFPNNGLAGSPIVLTGELNPATGEQLAVIDGGTTITGWTSVSGGGNVWRVSFDTSTANLPYNLNWNNKYILRIRTEHMATSEGLTILREGPFGADTYCSVTTTPGSPWMLNRYRSWNGIDAMWGWGPPTDNSLYVGFGDAGIDPNNEQISYALANSRGGAAITLRNNHFITVSNLKIQNAYNCVYVCNNSTDCIVENNLLIGGQHNANISENSSQIKILNNHMTLGYVHTLNPDNPRHWFIWYAFKIWSDYDRGGVRIYIVGSDNLIDGNHIYEHWDGVENQGSSTRLVVSNNLIEDLGDDGLEPDGGETDAKWHDNTVLRANVCYRHKGITSGPMYVYRNFFYAGPSTATSQNLGIYWFGGSTATAYIYHNTFATGSGAVFGSTNANIGLPNVWVVNNIFSCNNVFNDMSSYWPTDPNLRPHVDYNYMGGDRSAPLPWWGTNNNIIQYGQLWSLLSKPDFNMPNSNAYQNMGIDLSQSWLGNAALPDMTPGYFSGTKPDAGALQGNVVTNTPTRTRTPTATPTPTRTRTVTPSVTRTRTRTVTSTVTATPTRTWTVTPSITRTRTITATVSNSPNRTSTAISSVTRTRTITATVSNSPNRTSTATSSVTGTRTAIQSATATRTCTAISSQAPSPCSTTSATATLSLTRGPLIINADILSIYPQPARDELHLACAFQGIGKLELFIFNAAGEMVIRTTEPITASSLTAVTTIGIAKLSPGVYFLECVIYDGADQRQRHFARKIAITR